MTSTAVALSTLTLLLSGAVHAAIISSIGAFRTPGFSTGSLGPVGATPAPNNDDSLTDSPNLINTNVFFNSPGFLESEFILGNSGGTTEYRFAQGFINNTGATWTGFRFLLGFGIGDDFQPSTAADALRFDAFQGNSTATSNFFSLTVDQMDTLQWGGADVPWLRTVRFSFAIDVPDGLASANPYVLSRFTLRQIPLTAADPSPNPIPEPATYATLSAALAAVALYRRRRTY